MTELQARLDAVLRFAAARGLTDLHIKAGQRPVYRRSGTLISRKDEALFSDADLEELTTGLVPADRLERLSATGQVTFSLGLVGSGRFRVTAFRQRGAISLAVRMVPPRPGTLRELNLPRVLANWLQPSGGLVLVTGGPGSGRTATWAALLEQVNTSSPASRHLVTLEDPVEALFDDKVAFVQQREIGTDVHDLATGLQALARQDVDVVGVGDLDLDTFGGALALAAQGRLVVAALAGGSVVDVLERLLDHAGPTHQAWLRTQLARHLRGVSWQTLVPTADGKGRVPACEWLTVVPQVADALRTAPDPSAAVASLLDAPTARAAGQSSLDASLLELVQTGGVALEAALAVARRPEELRARMAGQRMPTQQAMPDF